MMITCRSLFSVDRGEIVRSSLRIRPTWAGPGCCCGGVFRFREPVTNDQLYLSARVTPAAVATSVEIRTVYLTFGRMGRAGLKVAMVWPAPFSAKLNVPAT